MRSYVDSDLHFFEIKYKSNKDITIKSRINIPKQVRKIRREVAVLLENILGEMPNIF